MNRAKRRRSAVPEVAQILWMIWWLSGEEASGAQLRSTNLLIDSTRLFDPMKAYGWKRIKVNPVVGICQSTTTTIITLTKYPYSILLHSTFVVLSTGTMRLELEICSHRQGLGFGH